VLEGKAQKSKRFRRKMGEKTGRPRQKPNRKRFHTETPSPTRDLGGWKGGMVSLVGGKKNVRVSATGERFKFEGNVGNGSSGKIDK